MRREALSTPTHMAALLEDSTAYIDLGARLRACPPKAVVTIARGSSDHAAQYMAYLTMMRLGHVVASLPMSLVTLHQAPLKAEGLVSVAFSQSGQSPDLIAPQNRIAESGGHTIAIVNHTDSPLARVSHQVLSVGMGEERSVAATKSYLGQLLAGARLVAHWQDDAVLQAAIQTLPETLSQAAGQDWSALTEALQHHGCMYVIGRSLGHAIALEAALKFKEVCGIQAEAYSVAEVRHGPMALIESGFPLLVFAPRGPAQAGLLDFAGQMRERGARVLLAAPAGTPHADLPLVTAAHPDLDALAAIQSFYPAIEQLAQARGLNPDQPPHLQKITLTH
jgi:glucosamine--fructose-6-phosphate aminotransferase (isomerizing)